MHPEIGMARESRVQIQIAGRATVVPGVALAGETDALALADAGFNPHLVGIRAGGVALDARPAQGDFTQRPVQRFLEGDKKVGLDVLAAGRTGRPASAGAEALAPAAKEGFEKIAEARAAELEARVARACGGAATMGPVGRAVAGRVVPIGPKRIVAPAFLRIAQDLVGLVDLFESLFGGGFVFRHVGMIEPRKFAEGGLDLVRRGDARDAERLVVVLELHGHDGSKPPPGVSAPGAPAAFNPGNRRAARAAVPKGRAEPGRRRKESGRCPQKLPRYR